jgi:NADPH2:quinone reductase
MEKAIVIREYGNSNVLKLENINVGSPDQDEIFIKHSAIGVHFHDCYVRSGLYKTLNLPGIPGLEAAGVIEEVGKGVSNFKPGDRIGYITSGYGAYASHRVLDKNLAFKIPEFISDELIATNFSRAITVQMLIKQVTLLQPDDTIIITAATGGVGKILSQLASSIGACVIGSVSTPEKALLAKSYGCKYVLTYDQEDFISQIMDVTNGKGVDKVYDSVGLETFDSSVASLRSCGHLINFGQSSGPANPMLMSTLASKSLTVSRPILFHYIANSEIYKKMTNSVFEAFQSKSIIIPNPEPYNLEDAALAHNILESRRGGGSLFLKP